jgi:hypothetical protein
VNKWKPIESAPKDGTLLLAFWQLPTTTECGVAFFDYFWYSPQYNNVSIACPAPTHWMPLPEPPK